MEGLVSIITPCFNSDKFIRETYHSIKNQEYSNWEWVIVDDSSVDKSVDIIKSFKDPRIKLIVNETNKGASVSRNLALEKARGEYITFIDSDDLWQANFLSKSLKYLEDSRETLVYSSYKRVDENLNQILDDFIAIDKVDYNRLLFNCPIPMLTAIYDCRKIGKIYFPEVDLREDHAMWLSLLTKTNYARAISEPLGIYRIRSNSVSRNKIKIAVKQFQLYRKHLKMNIFLSTYYTINWGLNGLKKYGKL